MAREARRRLHNRVETKLTGKEKTMPKKSTVQSQVAYRLGELQQRAAYWAKQPAYEIQERVDIVSASQRSGEGKGQRDRNRCPDIEQQWYPGEWTPPPPLGSSLRPLSPCWPPKSWWRAQHGNCGSGAPGTPKLGRRCVLAPCVAWLQQCGWRLVLARPFAGAWNDAAHTKIESFLW